jgi:hypothetical protein
VGIACSDSAVETGARGGATSITAGTTSSVATSAGGAPTSGPTTGPTTTGSRTTGPTTTGGAGGSAGSSSGAGGASTSDGGTPGGGYVTFGAWHGYAWTAASVGSSIMPADFAKVHGAPLCATGSVASGFDNTAMVGVNLNQAPGSNTALNTVTPTKAGVTVTVTNRTTATLRVQVQGPNGATDANDRWCATIFGSGGFLPWDAFNTKCWDGSGTKYAGQPLTAAMILVPGSMAAVPFDFCLDDIGEADAPGNMGSMGCSASGSAGTGTATLSDSSGWTGVTRDGHNYVVQNNVWGGSSLQVLSVSGVSFEVTQQTGSNGTSGAPLSYPSVFIGSNYGRSTTGSNLPKKVSALTSVRTGWSWTTAAGVFNAAYDVWFSTGPGGDASNPSGGYLMVWLHKPTNAQPISNTGASSGVVSLGGATYDFWIGTQQGRPIISYVRSDTTATASFDLKSFIDDGVSRGVVDAGWYLSNVFAGFEIWSGGVGLKTNDFCAIVD